MAGERRVSAWRRIQLRPSVLRIPVHFASIHVDEPSNKPSMKPTKTILVVEDHAVNRRLIEIMLEKGGYGVVMACDGQRGVEALRRGGVDLVLMDLMMPVMDGLEAMQAIVEQRLDQVPIIAVSANASRGIREQVVEAGFTDYLAKPFTPEILIAKVRQHLPLQVIDEDRAQGGPPAASSPDE